MQVYPIFLPLQGCPFRCIYCDQYAITGENNYTLDNHLEDIKNFCHKHKDEQKEIAFFGGTFTAFPTKWQEKQFEKLAIFLDENTGIRYSTRPDCITQDDIDLAKRYNVRTIELGIQDFNDNVLLLSKRGYSQEKAITACHLVKNNGIDLGIQMMPGLVGFNEESQKETKKIIIDILPKYVRIYPTVVLKNTELEDLYLAGSYQPLSLDDAILICADLSKEFTKKGIEVIKIGVQIDSHSKENIISGPYHPAFGELVQINIYTDRIISAVKGLGKEITIRYSPNDTSLLHGFRMRGIRRIENKNPDKKMNFVVDRLIQRYNFDIDKRQGVNNEN